MPVEVPRPEAFRRDAAGQAGRARLVYAVRP